jgi:branched-chain amino acid transport system ATP-binding protein
MAHSAEPAAAKTEVALLQAQGLYKSFGSLQVLRDVAFRVGQGEAVGIVGPNGAGKTTLLNVLCGSYASDSGGVVFENRDISGLSAARRCRLGIARTHQVPRPFEGMTVLENVLTAAVHGGGVGRAQADARAIDALNVCGMLHLANRRAGALGLLERKRLELTRALATGPRLLLLDEIGGGLTDGEAAQLVATIQSLQAGGVAIVWIEHIVHILLQVVTRLVCMDVGAVLAEGEPRSVLAHPAVVAAYLGAAQ